VSLGETLERIHQEQKWEAYEETWGHLHPKPGNYPGTLVVAHSEYDNEGVTVVHAQFENVADSPWLYEAMTLFAYRSMWPLYKNSAHILDTKRTKARGIWEFRGVLRAYQNGKLRFVGRWTKMSLYPGRIPATKPRRPVLSLSAAYQGKRKYMKGYLESDNDYMAGNQDSVVRFLDTMNTRRGR